jgi:hypothetical protein
MESEVAPLDEVVEGIRHALATTGNNYRRGLEDGQTFVELDRWPTVPRVFSSHAFSLMKPTMQSL